MTQPSSRSSWQVRAGRRVPGTRIVGASRRRERRLLAGVGPLVLLAAMLTVAVVPAGSASGTQVRAAAIGPKAVFGPASTRKFCTATSTYTPSRHVRTKIVRSSDGWSNTISSRYRKFTGCTARQMAPTMWCTTKLVDGFSTLCIALKPRAAGVSPCRGRTLDVRGVYRPRTGALDITCVNRARG